ncbi:MAG: Ima1 N-terminal domain-containing protein [Benjaminiella poitrasii]|nr:MAG: Ima1 N-terminal domain-containing protein [Benjaminiella poitrasii]
MSSYISNTKPTVFQVILNRLGIIELPLKVNCWYCSQDSYILPGSKNTVDHWYCYLCESTNARDQSGDIADPKHFEAYSENLKAPSFTRTQSTIDRKNERTLCESCQNNQSIIYELLSQYIPDENVSQSDRVLLGMVVHNIYFLFLL